MNQRTLRILIFLCLILVLTGLLFLPALEWILPSIPQMFFGQLQLTRDSAPLPPRAYQSAEFILGQVDYADIESAFYIYLQDDVLFWDPPYPGFPRKQLNLEEVRQLQEVLAGGKMFKQSYPEEGSSCLNLTPGVEPEWVPCLEGEEVWERFNDFRFAAYRTREVGLLLIQLTRGRMVEIRISPGENGLAFEPTEKAGPWWIDGITTAPFPLLEEFAARAELEKIEVLWLGLNEAQANDKAQRILGKRYQRALEVVQNSSQVRGAFGEIKKIRPALGNNSYSSWMDSSSITLTFYVVGTKADGAVLAQGDECFDLQLVVEGVPVRERIDYVCP